MPKRGRSTVRDLRRDNRSMLLSSLYFGQSCSRHDLCGTTGLSPASVSNVVRELIDEGIVAEAGSADSDGGRPRVLLQINADHGYVIGVDVGDVECGRWRRGGVGGLDIGSLGRSKAREKGEAGDPCECSDAPCHFESALGVRMKPARAGAGDSST